VKIIANFIRKEIYCNRIKVGRNGGKRKKHLLLPMQQMRVKTPKMVQFWFLGFFFGGTGV
jgi:hypothetical protein